ncbi:MAG: phosphonopyruvate decarboxylase [Symploca sp. SIO2G7]|nr:phosphonopyruvate decarboxylase [Symploca sp. SIO2G7]
MISVNRLLEELVARDVSLIAGVPCSYLTSLINATLANPNLHYIPSSSEGEALAISAGAWLSGRIGVTMQQNSGLGNIVNPLTSLSTTFKIPSLLFITWRGEPGKPDEPQHKLMGQITPDLLTLMEIPWSHLPTKDNKLSASLDVAFKHMQQERKPYVFLIRKGDIESSPRNKAILTDSQKIEKKRLLPSSLSLTHSQKSNSVLPSRVEALRLFLNTISIHSPVIATTGKCGRELFTLTDEKRNLYCVGSMGYANAIAHGIALVSSRTIYVLDGDGALLMHMGNLATIGAAGTKNLVHVLLDNAAYDTTGGQPTVSKSIDFVRIASACGYKNVISCSHLNDFEKALNQKNIHGPRFIHIHIRKGSLENLGRPTISPDKVAKRFRQFMLDIPISDISKKLA